MIHLIVGNTGAGKTTYSKKLKKETQGLVYSIDKWNKTLFLQDKQASDGLEWFLNRIERIEDMIQLLILQSEESNIDSILDLGLSKFSHRQKFRDFAHKNHIQVKLHYLDIPENIRWQRVKERNINQGDTYEFQVTEKDFSFMESWFEALTPEELMDAVVIQ